MPPGALCLGPWSLHVRSGSYTGRPHLGGPGCDSGTFPLLLKRKQENSYHMRLPCCSLLIFQANRTPFGADQEASTRVGTPSAAA